MIKLTWSEKSKTDLIANLSQLNMNVKSGAKEGLKQTANNIMAASRSECPIDTMALVNSSYSEEPKVNGDVVSIKFGYGGPNDKMNPDSGKMASEYALEVHETPPGPPNPNTVKDKEFMDFSNADHSHAYHPYGKWKYLEDPVRASQMTFLDITGREISFKFREGIRP